MPEWTGYYVIQFWDIILLIIQGGFSANHKVSVANQVRIYQVK